MANNSKNMCKSLIALTVLTQIALSAAALQEIHGLTKSFNITNDTEREVNSRHEMSTDERAATNTALPSAAETHNLTTTTTTTATARAASEVTTLSPLQYDNNTISPTTTSINIPSPSSSLDPFCEPSLCEQFNGTHTQVLPHIACHNHGNFAPTCGSQPHLLDMSVRRRNLILDLHNLARSRIASGQVADYKPATHMPQLKWDTELEHMAALHAKRCKFTHDMCRNTPRFHYSGQNIGYYWIRREIKSHSRRMKNFIVNWFKEYLDANQTYIDSYQLHPDGKQIGHFTQLVSDRVHRVGCAAIRYREPDQPNDTKFLLTCNYDFTNIWGEPIYQSGPTASKCVYKRSKRFPELCDWKEAVYEYDTEQYADDENVLDNNIPLQ